MSTADGSSCRPTPPDIHGGLQRVAGGLLAARPSISSTDLGAHCEAVDAGVHGSDFFNSLDELLITHRARSGCTTEMRLHRASQLPQHQQNLGPRCIPSVGAGDLSTGRAAEESLMSGCGPTTRATCSAVFLVHSRRARRSALPPGHCGGSWWRAAFYFVGFRSSFGVGFSQVPHSLA